MRTVPDICHLTLAAYGHLLRMSRTRSRHPDRSFWHSRAALWHLAAENPQIQDDAPGTVSVAPMLVAESLHHSDPRWLPGWDPDGMLDPGSIGAAREIIVSADFDSPEEVFEWGGFHCSRGEETGLCLLQAEPGEWFDEARWREAIESAEFPDPAGPGGALSGRVTSAQIRDLSGGLAPLRPCDGPARVPVFEIDCGSALLNLWATPWAFLLFPDRAPGSRGHYMLCEYTGYPSREAMRQEGPMAGVCGMGTRSQFPGWDFDAPDGA